MPTPIVPKAYHRSSYLMKKKEARLTFNTRLPVSVLLELDHAAKETHRKKNNILVEAVTEWLAEYMKTTALRQRDDHHRLLRCR
jgi:hypothetical protein